MASEAMPPDGDHRVELDPRTNTVRVTAPGFWTPEQLTANMVKTERVLAAARSSGRQLRVLIDLRRSRVQSGETADRIRVNSQRMYRPEDRVVLVVGSELAKMQAKRLQAGAPNRGAFLTMPEAETWLNDGT